MLQPLIQVVESGVALHGFAISMLTPGIVGSVELYFGDQGIQITANPDTDEIVLLSVERPQRKEPLLGCPFQPAVGKPLFQAWAGTNDRGYKDMIQLCFGRDVADEHIVVQVQAIASGLTMWSVCSAGPPFADGCQRRVR